MLPNTGSFASILKKSLIGLDKGRLRSCSASKASKI